MVAKDKFLSLIAHDLKNPMTSIVGLSQIMADDFEHLEKEDLKFMVENIAGSSDNLSKLLDNLLLWACTQRNQIEVRYEQFQLSEVIKKNILLITEMTRNKNQTILEYKANEHLFMPTKR